MEAAALRLSTRFAARADAVLAPSTVVRDELRARGVRTPIAVVPTGVDLERFCPGDRGGGAPAARASPTGDAAGALRRAARPREERGPRARWRSSASPAPWRAARLVLVGQGTEAERLRRLAAASPVGHRASASSACGRTTTLVECYQAADLFLFASETETQGLVLAEAAACGLPAVAVNAPGCDEVVRDGETGILTKGDPAALAEAAIGLLLDRRAPPRHGPARARRWPSGSSTCGCRSTARWPSTPTRSRARPGPMSRRHETHRRINAEIVHEKAAALGRAGERLEEALADVVTLGRRLDAATDPEAEARSSATTRPRGPAPPRAADAADPARGGRPPPPPRSWTSSSPSRRPRATSGPARRARERGQTPRRDLRQAPA